MKQGDGIMGGRADRVSGISINTKITMLITVMVLSCSVFVGIFSYMVYRNDCIGYKTETASSVSEAVAAIIDPDAFSEIIATGQKTDYYYDVQPIFEDIWLRSGVEYLYAFVEDEDGVNYRYIFDAEGEELFGNTDEIEGYGAEETFATGELETYIGHTDEYGWQISSFSPVFGNNGEVIGAVGADLQVSDVMDEISDFGLKIVLAVAMFNLVFIVISRMYLNRALGRPIKELTHLGACMAEGNLDAQARIRGNDEIGRLSQSFTHVSETLRRLLAEMDEMAEKQKGGDYEAFIDSERYKGAYYAVASAVNSMARENFKDFTDVITAFSALGDGDFEAELRRFPGKKAIVNDAVDNVRLSLKGFNNELRTLAASASNGDMSQTIDVNKMKGGWRVLAENLNGLLQSVIEPIREAAEVLDRMSAGDFGGRVTGEYKGDFSIIKNSLNATQDEVSSYIHEISSMLGEMSGQNLDLCIDRQYIGDFGIIKESINRIIDTLNTVFKDINSSAEQTAQGAMQISNASGTLSQGATEQASAIEQLNASVLLISSQTDKNADIARLADSLAHGIKDNVSNQARMMQETLNAMQGINEASENISKIIKVIEDIAFQTNILALNASVEAARAGVHGKGFAVVAEEVRNLAGRSQEAAKDTTRLIDSSVQKAHEGARVTTETAAGLNAIVGQVSELSTHIMDIARASNEQSANINQISSGISQIAQVTQSNTAISIESAASAQELSAQAQLLRETAARFRLRG